MAKQAAEKTAQNAIIHMETRPLYPEKGAGGALAKILKPQKIKGPKNRSNLHVAYGMKPHPFDMREAAEWILGNIDHARCVRTKRNSTVGLGHSNEKTAKILNKLCDASWQEELNKIGDDYWILANAYLECVWDSPDRNEIIGLHHVPGADVHVVLEDRFYNYHYMIQSKSEGFGDQRFARFGDLLGFSQDRERAGNIIALGYSDPAKDDRASELIHFKQVSSLSRWYGICDYLPAIPSMELNQCHTQHAFDFFFNGGVPEFALFILGAKLPPKDFAEIKATLQQHVGLGNARKSLVSNIHAGSEIKVQLEKLAMEGKSDAGQFAVIGQALSERIVAAHGVPHLLANIPQPGKMGAANEFANALMSFQTTIIAEAQHSFEQTLDSTLGDPEKNGGIRGLKAGMFELNKITDVMSEIASKLISADTVGRMKQSVPAAGAEGRDLSAGVKKHFRKILKKELGQLVDESGLKPALATKVRKAFEDFFKQAS